MKLKSFDAAQKLKVIKEVRAITNLGLKEVSTRTHARPQPACISRFMLGLCCRQRTWWRVHPLCCKRA